MTTTPIMVELRCPNNLGGLLAKVRQYDDYHGVNSDNLLELACRDCRKEVEKQTGKKPEVVVHCFDVAGTFIETNITWA